MTHDIKITEKQSPYNSGSSCNELVMVAYSGNFWKLEMKSAWKIGC